MSDAPRMGIPRDEIPSRIDGVRQPVFDGSGTPIYRLPPGELLPGTESRMSIMALDWGVQALNCAEAHKVTKGAGVKVCIADTGTDPLHPDLKDAYKSDSDMRSFVRGQSFNDGNGHGTHCAGRSFARGAECGVAPEAIGMCAKVLSNSGSGGVDGIADGIRWAADNGADVISMSLGSNAPDSYIPPALDYADKAGVIIVAAAGNDGPGQNTQDYPGSYPQCVCVGAEDANLVVANFSSRGPALFVGAPGVNIRSQYPGGRYATMSGTSMATPHVAGLAALWVASHPNVAKKDRPSAFRSALQAVCKDQGPTGRDTAYGWGFPDAAKLVAGGSVSPPPPPPVGDVLFGVKATVASAIEGLKALGYTVTKATEADVKAFVEQKFRIYDYYPRDADGGFDWKKIVAELILAFLKSRS